MTGVRLTLRERLRQPLDLAPLLPERLTGLVERQIAEVALRLGNAQVVSGELFTITIGDAAGDVVIAGATPLCDRLGAGMTSGTLIVEGDVGNCLGLGMSGGHIELRGSAQALAGAEATGGVLSIAGDAGPRLGGALPGAGGLNGGTLLVRGSCGEMAGQRMRRGLIVVEGAAGPHVAMGMRGGTIVVNGDCAADPAPLMSRGSLLLAHEPERLLPTFADDGRHEFTWLRLLQRHLASLGLAGSLPFQHARRLAGDLAGLGKGEILLPA